VIQPIDAMPFANVISTLTYNPAKSIYVVAHDPRMTVTYTITNEKGDGDEQYRAQNFTFSFAAGVHYFRAYDGSGNNGYWSGTPALFAPNYHAGYTLSLSLDKVAAQQESPVAVLATDTTNCTPSSTALPSDFNWAKLASNGLFTPEYYEQRVGHPQG
jgi:hypothetical protein